MFFSFQSRGLDIQVRGQQLFGRYIRGGSRPGDAVVMHAMGVPIGAQGLIQPSEPLHLSLTGLHHCHSSRSARCRLRSYGSSRLGGGAADDGEYQHPGHEDLLQHI